MATWRDLWSAVLGFPPVHQYLDSVVLAVLVYFCLCFTFCFILYKLSDLILPNVLRGLALDFFKTMVYVTYPLGHGLMRHHHGHLGYIFFVVPLNITTCLTFTKGRESINSTVISLTSGTLNFVQYVFHCIVQVLASFAALRLGLLIMGLDFHETFTTHCVAFSPVCDTDLRLPLVMGFLLEFLGTTWDAWVFLQHFSRHTLLDLGIKFLNTALLVSFGYNKTGMYMSPAMATALNLGCGDTSVSAHFLVYWIGPILGVLSARWINQHLRISLVGSKKGEEKGAGSQNSLTVKRKQA